MLRIYYALLLCYVLLFSGAFIAGLFVDGRDSFALHFGLGLVATLFTCLAHCIILVYFIITGKLVKQAVDKGHLDPDYIPTTQRIKGRISILIALGFLATLAAAMAGALIDNPEQPYGQRGTMHMFAECGALVLNAALFIKMYQHIHRNQQVVGEVFQRLQDRAAGSLPRE
jgi:amino acid transporter